jgi:hypothetical protein
VNNMQHAALSRQSVCTKEPRCGRDCYCVGMVAMVLLVNAASPKGLPHCAANTERSVCLLCLGDHTATKLDLKTLPQRHAGTRDA